MRRVLFACAILVLGVSACSSTKRVFETRETLPPPEASSPGGRAVAANVHYDNGLRIYEKEKYRQAAIQFQLALQDDRSNYKAAYYLGVCMNERGRYEDARSAFRLALELGPDPATQAAIHAGMGYGFEMQRDYNRAHDSYTLAMLRDRGNTYALKGHSRVTGIINGHQSNGKKKAS
jgi:tetratricopeptide (TPR) repeat protein